MSIEELEQLRKQTVKKCNLTIFIGLLLIGLAIFLFITFVHSINNILIFIVIVGITVISLINGNIKTKYINTFMQSLLPIAVQNILTNVEVDVTKGISRSLIDSTHSMYTGDRFMSNNYVSGYYKDIKTEMSDVLIQEEHEDSEGHSSYVTIFKGQWMIFDFNKYFKSNIQVWEKKVFGGISKRVSFKQHKVEMEDIEFNKKFKVIADNDLDAFYILTPKIMERITEVEKAVNGTLLMVFLNNQLHVGVYNNKTTFKINIRKKINFEEFASNSIKDLDAIVKFVDILELDNNLFKVGEINTNSVNPQPVVNPNVESQPVVSEPVYTEQPEVLDESNLPNNVDAVDYLNNLTNNSNQ